jgi:CHAT domain-containing protein
LAILSACETNYGPDQQGEGVWALSRGFLVAGSRRVIASNWLVDDEAGANLIALLGAEVASKPQSQADYAQALQKAKLAIRQQEKWASPYYWASFVLIGPQ